MPQDLIAEAARLTATDILDILERNFTSRRPGQFVLFREFPLEAESRGRSICKIDGLLVKLSHARRADRTAIEVKVSRADFQRELLNPEKRRRAMRIADRFYFAVPYGLIGADEVPDDCGLYWIHPAEFAPTVVKAPKFIPAQAPDWPLVRDMIWRAFALGQEDAARRDPLAAWPEVERLAEIAANPFAEDAERSEALEDFKRALLRHGRKDEARRIRGLENDMCRLLGGVDSTESASI